MVKPIYGFKDAPRARRQKLQQVLMAWEGAQQLFAEPELYCAHGTVTSIISGQSGTSARLNAIERAKEHTAEQAEQSQG